MKTMISKRTFLLSITVTLFVLLSGIGLASAQGSFPEKAIQVVIPYGPGGLSDLSFRTFAKAWEPVLGVKIMVVNKSGGGGLIGGEYVASSKPDGYTLGYLSGRQTLPEIYAKKHPYESTNLRPIFQVIYGVPSIAVKKNAPWNSLSEFIGYAKKNPGLQYASTGRGATPHLTAEKLAEVAGLRLEEVPYGGDAKAVTALLGGDTKVAFLNLPATVTQLEAGNVKVLAIHAPKRMSVASNVPTFIEQGIDLPLGVLTYVAVFAPAGIPEEAARHLVETAKVAAQKPDTMRALEKLGTYPKFSYGQEFISTIRQYRIVVGTLMKNLGLYQE